MTNCFPSPICLPAFKGRKVEVNFEGGDERRGDSPSPADRSQAELDRKGFQRILRSIGSIKSEAFAKATFMDEIYGRGNKFGEITSKKMSIEQLNKLLKNHESLLRSQPSLFVLMTGASGAGKSYLAKALEEKLDPKFAHLAYFDHIGVPPVEEMIEKFGSGEKWQEAMTHKWLQMLASKQD